MNHVTRLLIPVGLGLFASFMNWRIVTSQVAPSAFVAIRAQVDSGEPIEESALCRLMVPGDPARARKTLIPWEDRALLIGRVAGRDFKPGDVVFHRDLVRERAALAAGPGELALPFNLEGLAIETGLLFPGEMVDFLVTRTRESERPTGVKPPVGDDAERSLASRYELIGPFKLLAVGKSLTIEPTEKEESKRGSRGDERVITVAARLVHDADGHEALDRLALRLKTAEREKRLVSILLRPSPSVGRGDAEVSADVTAAVESVDGGRIR
ncbi:MAG: hypothetical protein AB7I30_07710 [Isosphaeraceae bacterium]